MGRPLRRRATVLLVALAAVAGVLVAGSGPAAAHSLRPIVTGMSIHHGSAQGDTSVTIHGWHFNHVNDVYFDGARATSIHRLSPRTVRVHSPGSRGARLVHVVVRTLAGRSRIGHASGFRYYIPTPRITSISKHLGSTRDGAVLNVYGHNLTHVTSVRAGGPKVHYYFPRPCGSIYVNLGPHAVGAVNIRVTTRWGTSPVVTADRFTYYPPPEITGLDRVAGPATGGTQVTVHGRYLDHLTGLRFGSGTATHVVTHGSTVVTAATPAHQAGLVHTVATTRIGSSDTYSSDRFRFGGTAGVRWSAPTEIDPVRTDGAPYGDLADISCAATTTFCAAIDRSANWLTTNGSTWSAPTRAAPPGAVSCATAARCVAVGGAYSSVFDATSFAVPFNTVAPGAQIADVSCPTTNFCLAVGDGKVTTGDGTTWSQPARPFATPVVAASCWAAGECAAVSEFDIMYLHGGVWQEPVSLFSHLTAGDRFATIDCPDASACFLGTDDGAVTRVAPGGIASTYRVLPRIGKLDCAAATSCVALDATGTSLAVWDGTTWSAPATTPDPVSAISCPADGHCIALGKTTASTLDW